MVLVGTQVSTAAGPGIIIEAVAGAVAQGGHLNEQESLNESVPLPGFTVMSFRWSHLFTQGG